jgi:hypothetical protein
MVPPHPGKHDRRLAGTYAPKGAPGHATGASIKANRAAGASTATAKTLTASFFYNLGSEGLSANPPTGAYTMATINQPYLNSNDHHTLVEIAAESADEQQVIEVGATVDRDGVNGTDYTHPHLFVFSWVNGVPQCYNGCGFVQYTGAGAVLAGADLSSAVGSFKEFGIEYFSGVWWISYGNNWVGYFPGSHWSGVSPAFTSINFYQQFGEVAAGSTTPCTDMGTGYPGDATHAHTGAGGAAAIGNTAYVNGPTTVNLYMRNNPSTLTQYTIYPLPNNTRSFYYGGQGWGNVVGGC